MKLNLNPELIYDFYKNGKLDEKIASERLIAIIESELDEDKRVKSVEILGKISSEKHKNFKIMENLLVSDSNERVRYAATNIILDNFFNKGLKVIKWALRHEKYPKCLSIILKSMNKANPKFLRKTLRNEIEKIRKNHPQILNHFYDCMSLPQNIDWLTEIFIKSKSILFLKNKYGKKFLDYAIEDDEFVKIVIIGLEVENISDIIGLEDLTELKYLDLSGNQIREIDFMGNFPKLEFLHLKENQIKEIKGLEKLTNLAELYLSSNQITEIKGLDKLKNLTVLDLSENNISKIKGLDSLFNLCYIFLHGNNIEKIEGIENLENLRELNLGENQISKIEGLNNLENLHELNLGENRISKIEGLDTLINLRTLYLYNNQIATLEGVENLKNLHFIDLRNNIISKNKENVLNIKKRLNILYSQLSLNNKKIH